MRTIRLIAFTAVFFAGFTPSQALASDAGVAPGDIVVGNLGRDSDRDPASLLIIDSRTGKQSILSQGGLIDIPLGMAFDRGGHRLLVVNSRNIVAVDATTGAQSFITSLPGIIFDIAIEAPGRFLLADYEGRLLRYDEAADSVEVVASGGLIGGVSPWAVQMDGDGRALVAAGTPDGLDIPGLPSRVLAIDIDTGVQSLVTESLDIQFRGFTLVGDAMVIVTNSRGYPAGADPLQDGVSRLDLGTGLLSPLFTGLQRPLDVGQLPDGRFVVLDQVLTLEDLRSPVVYKERGKKLQPLSTYGEMFLPQSAIAVQCLEDADCRGQGHTSPGRCGLQGTCL